MEHAPRISVLDAQDKVLAGSPILIVCAYDSETRFAKNRIEGAIPLWEFEKRLPTLEKPVEIVFY